MGGLKHERRRLIACFSLGVARSILSRPRALMGSTDSRGSKVGEARTARKGSGGRQARIKAVKVVNVVKAGKVEKTKELGSREIEEIRPGHVGQLAVGIIRTISRCRIIVSLSDAIAKIAEAIQNVEGLVLQTIQKTVINVLALISLQRKPLTGRRKVAWCVAGCVFG